MKFHRDLIASFSGMVEQSLTKMRPEEEERTRQLQSTATVNKNKVNFLIIVLAEHYNCHNISIDSDNAMTVKTGQVRSPGQF